MTHPTDTPDAASPSETKPVILLVDDDEQVLAAFGRDVRKRYRKDFRILSSDSPEEALETLTELGRRGTPIAMVIADQRMPGMTGVEACMLLKEDEDTKNIPVIFVTSMDDKHNESVGFSVGAVDYINKPPSPEIVMARVKVHLQNNQLRRFVEAVGAGELEGDTAKEKAAKLLK